MWIGKLILSLVVLALVMLLLNLMTPGIQDTILAANGRGAEKVFQVGMAPWLAELVGNNPLTKWALLVVEMWIFSSILLSMLWSLVRRRMSLALIASLCWMVLTVLPSIAMGIYAHTVLWGDFPMSFPLVGQFKAFRPQSGGYMFGIVAVAVPALLYLLTDIVTIILRPPAAVLFMALSWAASIFPIAEILSASILYVVRSYQATGFQEGAIYVWSLTALIELGLFIIAAMLVRRSMELQKSFM